MEIGGPFAFGDLPDDFGLPGSGGEADAPQRGWLPPEDRLWRHPSELRAGAGADTATRRPRQVNRWVAATVGVVGAATVATVAVAVTRGPAGSGPVTAVTIAASDTTFATSPAHAPSATHAGSVSIGADVVQIVASARPSMVTLLSSGGSGAARATGVVLPGGMLVATAASAVGTTTRFTVVGADGRRQTGELVGADARSGIAVLRLAEQLTAASFADEVVSAHELAVAACLCGSSASRTSSTDMADVAVGMVHEVGTAATLDGGPSLVDAIEAEMPLGASSWGSVLLDDQGQVLGILDGERNVGDDVFGYFVPAPLAVGVADELAKDHRVARGWLGIVCADAPSGGAQVTTVLAGGPAAVAGLHTGDVVEAVDARPVSSLADLQAELYTTTPGTRLLLTVLRGEGVTTVPVTAQATPS